ncbi:MAG: hypothetical protein PHV60_01135 [bacterium]|nr:hypothetical protein [bacterium]
MDTKSVRYISIFTGFILSLFIISSHCLAQEKLFSILYGEEEAQIGVYIPNYENDGEDSEGPVGPSDFCIDTQGNVYIADVMSQVIKKYSPIGVFILKTEPIDSLDSLCIDNEENIYAIHGTTNDQLTKFDKNGTLVWSKTIAEFKNPVNYQGLTHVRIINDFLYLETSLGNVMKYIKIDKEGVFVEEVPSDELDGNGNYYTLGKAIYSFGNIFRDDKKNTGEYISGGEFDLVNSSRNIIKSYRIIFPDEYGKSDQLRGIRDWDYDSRGNMYATVYIYRASEQQIIYDNGLFIDSDDLIFKFDKESRHISTVSFPSSPFINQRESVRLDSNNNIYYLQFYADHLDVVKVSSDNIPPKTNISISPFPNIAAWNNSDITITLTATDNEGGSGVKEIHYTLTGAVNEDKVVPGQTAQIVLKSEGTTTISYYTLDNAGNKDETKSLILNLDKTAPLVSLNLEPYKIKLPFRHETYHFYTPFFYKLTYSVTDNLSGIKGSKTGLITPDISGFKTQLMKGKQLHITVNVDKKHVIIIAPNPQQVLEQLKGNLLVIDNNQVMHLNQRPKAKGWMINKTDKFLVISAPSIVFKTEASDYADNLTAKELKYEKKKMPMPDHCKLMINRKEFSQEEIEDLMEDMNIDTDTMKNIRKNYKVK